MNDSFKKRIKIAFLVILTICIYGVPLITGKNHNTPSYPEETTNAPDYNDNTDHDSMESAREAVDNMCIGWNLGNSFDVICDPDELGTDCDNSDFETYWGNPVTPDTLMQKLKNLGFESVRIPVTWNYHFDEDASIDEAWMSRVQEVVDQAMEADLYCIINLHHDTGEDGWLMATDENYSENCEKYSKLWKQIAERYKDYPDKLLFEGFNEMLDDDFEWDEPSEESIKVINQYNQLFVDTVRATGGNNYYRNLLCTTYAASETPTILSGFTIPQDYEKGHIIEELHFYIPYEFIETEDYTEATIINEYTSDVEKSVDEAFAIIKENSAKDIPIVIGEFASCNNNNTAARIKWYTRVIQKAKEQSITCFIWDSGRVDRTALIDRVDTQDYFPEIISACIKASK